MATGLGIACVSGVLFFLLTILGARGVVVRLIPVQIKLSRRVDRAVRHDARAAQCGMVVANAKTNAFVLGDFSRPGALVALIGLAVAIVLQARRCPARS